MKIKVTMEFEVVETREGVEIHDDQGLCLTRGPNLQEAMEDMRSLVTGTALTDDLQVQIVDIIDVRAKRDPLGGQ